MKLAKPYVDEQKQVIFVEFENELLQDVVNGMLLALVVFGPIALVTPPIL